MKSDDEKLAQALRKASRAALIAYGFALVAVVLNIINIALILL